jgi:sugar phosphate isomerase/epimerase
MQQSIHDYVKLGIVHFMAYPECASGEGDLVTSISSLAHDPYFNVLEITQIKDGAVRQAVRDIAAQTSTALVFGAQPILLGGKLNLNDPDESGRHEAIAAVQKGIDQAAEMGCHGVAVLSGAVSEDRGSAKARLVDSLRQLCAYGRPKGIPVVLETFDQVPYGKNCLIGPTRDAVEVSEKVREEYPAFGLMLDLSHLPLQDETPSEAITLAGRHLVHAHMGNCAMDDPSHPAYGDNHPCFGAPGTRNGVEQLQAYLEALLASGYLSEGGNRILSFEVKPMAGETSAHVLENCKETLRAAWERI